MKLYDEQTEEVRWGCVSAIVGAVVVLALLITFGVWALGIATAPWVGRANLHRQLYDPANIQAQYERFFTLDADIHTDAATLKATAVQVRQTADPTEQDRLRSVELGLTAHCHGLVNDYNNSAKAYTRNAFLSKSLPPEEDPNVCEVSS